MTDSNGPDPKNPHPVADAQTIGFLNQFVKSPLIEIGDYTYYHDFGGPENFERDNVLYHFDFVGDRLIIGRYCALAHGATFIMNGANHSMAGLSTYPFHIFGGGWEKSSPPEGAEASRGDTIIGNDVWIGYKALILPGVKIGDGAVIGSGSVVAKNVEPFTIAAGNPARPIKMRFDDEIIAALLKLRWWDWPAEKVTANLQHIVNGDLDWLQKEAERLS